MMSNLRASVDIGSNSCLLLIARIDENQNMTVLESQSFVTALGKDLDKTQVFCEEAMKDTYEAIKIYSETAKKYSIPPSQMIVTATEASRVALNSQDFFKKIKKELNVDVKIITSQAEAFYSSLGVLCDKKELQNPLYILDIGGASTELIKLDSMKKEMLYSFSMPVGSVRYSGWMEKQTQEKKIQEVFDAFSSDLVRSQTKFLCCVAGTMTSIANMYLKNPHFEENEVHGLLLKTSDIFLMKKMYQNFTSEDFLAKFPFLGKRAKTIKAGIEIICEVIQKLGVETIYVSTFGLRYGTLLSGEIKNEYIARK